MRLYIIRHADPDYANDTITELGQRQAKHLASRLKSVRIDRLYTSPMGRARATAAVVEREIGMEAQVLPWARELGLLFEQPAGSGQVMHLCDLHGHIIRQWEPLPHHDDWHTRPPLDASRCKDLVDAMICDADQFFATHGYVRSGFVYDVQRSHTEAMAIICHGGFGLTLLAHLLAIPMPLMWAGFFLPPTSITTVLFDERGESLAAPRCICLGDAAHLDYAGISDERIPVGIIGNYY